MKHPQLSEILKQISDELTLGHISLAKSMLIELVKGRKLSKSYRHEKLAAARLFRRAGMWIESLRILHPFVRSENLVLSKGRSGEEFVEYAASLIQLGARYEAEELLLNPLAQKIKEADLFKAFLHFSKWEYAEAIPLLERYAQSPGLGAYEKAVAQINLFAAMAITRSNLPLLKNMVDFEKELRNSKFLRLASNINEIMSQVLISLKLHEEAEKRLNGILQNESVSPLERLLAQKWQAVNALEKSASQKSIKKLLALKNAANKIKHYETLRDIDYHYARITENQSVLEKLFIGTPHRAYQERVRKYLNDHAPKKSYLWQLSSKSAPQFVLDSQAQVEPWFKRGDLNHRIISTLSRDFYAPTTIAELHASLFLDEFFNPYSSPNRIHAAVYRLNLNFKSNAIPIRVSTYDEGYKLIPLKIQAGILVHPQIGIHDRFDSRMNDLQNNMDPENSFSRHDAKVIWQVADRTANVLLKKAVEQGILYSIGKGPSCRYKFSQSNT